MLATAPLEYLGAVEVGDLTTKDALFLEEFKGIRVQDLRPLIPIIPGGVASRKDMFEGT